MGIGKALDQLVSAGILKKGKSVKASGGGGHVSTKGSKRPPVKLAPTGKGGGVSVGGMASHPLLSKPKL